MSDDSDNEFYYPEEEETAERKASCCGWHFDKVAGIGDTDMKSYSSSGCIDFCKYKKCHIINYVINLNRSVFMVKYQTSTGFAVVTSLSFWSI